MQAQQRKQQQTLVINRGPNNSIEAVRKALQDREPLPAGQVPLLFVPAKVEEQVKTAVEKAAAAAKAAQAAAEETQELEKKLAALKAKKEAATKRNANTRAAENAQRAAAAAVKAAEEAVKAAGETEARTVKVACGELSNAAVDLQQLFVHARTRDAPPPTEPVPLNLKGTLSLAADMAHSAATLGELDVRCPDPEFPPLPKLGLKLWNPFGSRTATAAPPPPPPGGPGYTLAAFLPRWPGHGGPPPVPQRAEPPQAAAILVAAAAPPRPHTEEEPASLRLRIHALPGLATPGLSRQTDNANRTHGKRFTKGNTFISLRNAIAASGAKPTGSPAAAAARRAAGAGEGGGTRTRRPRRRGTRRH